MNQEVEIVPVAAGNAPVIEMPFVNDECGDTMWDEVLREMYEKEKKNELAGFDLAVKL